MKYFKLIVLSLLLAIIVSCGGSGGDGTSGSPTAVSQPDEEVPFAVVDLPTTLSLRWNSPTTYTDNTALQAGDLTRYRIYFGTEEGNFTEVREFDALVYPNAYPMSELNLETLKPDRNLVTVYMAMTAVDKDGIESQLSEVLLFGI